MLLAVLGQIDLALPLAVQKPIMSSKNKYASVVSVWEIAIKYRIGKLKLSVPLFKLPDLINQQNIVLLPIGVEHTLVDIGPEPTTKDPFDRLLLGVCAAEGMKLLTIDRALVDHPLAWR